nr:MAG TPA: hypothetical protein [Siphoviridae sp. ctUxW2]
MVGGEPTILHFLITFNLFKNLSKNTTNTSFVSSCFFKLLSLFLSLFNCL